MKGLPRLSYASHATFWRSLQTLNVTRIVIAGVLLIYMVFGAKADGGILSPKLGQLCGLYLVVAFAFALTALRWRHRFLLQLASQVAIDIVVISLLYQDAGGVRSGLAILYLFPLAGAAILAPLLLALFSAAIVTLFMLAESTWQILTQGGERATVQAGLYGAAFFALVLVLSRFAGRLIGQEELAVQRGNALAIQQAINRLVIADMGDGIVVVDRGGEVFTGNPAASRMLGLSGFLAGFDERFRLGDSAALQPIALAYQDWLADPSRRTAFVTIKPYNDASLEDMLAAWNGRRDLAAHLKVRFATVDTAGLAAERYVIFLQDVTAIENQAQQLKLASMGRLTASIAHEVRNPLSAIGHATALLGEDLDQPVHLRLLKIVGDNVARVNRMVEDILQLSRKVQVQVEPLPLTAFLVELKTEFQETHALASDVIAIDPHGASVRFDPLHLREIVINLLNNAVRYASRAAGSMHLFVIADRAGRLELHVQDDGPGISPEVRAHLFEPFYTTSSKGTGLGLYLARELCLNNGALLDYEYRFGAGVTDADLVATDIAAVANADTDRQLTGRFVITFARQV